MLRRSRLVFAQPFIRIAMLASGLATAVVLTPVAFAMLMLRCCSSSAGASFGAWIIAALAVIAGALGAAFLGGVAAAGVRSIWLRSGRHRFMQRPDKR